MKLGFYYHITLSSSPKGYNVPAYLGLFLDSLASKVERLTLFMHNATEQESVNCDYILKSGNIDFVCLGRKTKAWERFLRPGHTLRKISSAVKDVDVLLVRAPSPLAPAFYKYFKDKTRVAYLIVGDNLEGIKHLKQPWWRMVPITVLSAYNNNQLSAVLKRSKTIVNSQELYDKYMPFVNDLHLVKTTTLSNIDFYSRFDTCQRIEIKILYTGRFSFAKGLRELIDAFATLSRDKGNLTLHLVGWDEDPSKPVENYLKEQIYNQCVADKVIFHGFKTVGHDLNEMYRMADIYIMPSYHEGFPRTIWEAMANSLPVIATKVGSIPHFIKDGTEALLIDPGNPDKIVDAVKSIIENKTLRQTLIRNGFKLAGENTLEVQAQKMHQILMNIHLE